MYSFCGMLRTSYNNIITHLSTKCKNFFNIFMSYYTNQNLVMIRIYGCIVCYIKTDSILKCCPCGKLSVIMSFFILSVVVVPYLNTAYLAAVGLGKFVYELNDTGVLVRCGGLLYIGLQLLDKLGRTCIAL